MANITIDGLPPLTALDGNERIPLAKFNGIGWSTQYVTTGAIGGGAPVNAGYVVLGDSSLPDARLLVAYPNQTVIVDNGDSVEIGLAVSGVTAGTYGDGSHVLTLGIDAYGRVTSVATTAISTGSVFNTITLNGSTSGTTVVQAKAVATGTITLPSTTDTLLGRATTDTLTNKTFDTAGTGNVFKIAGTAITATTGTGNVVLDTGATLTTPTLTSPTMTTPTMSSPTITGTPTAPTQTAGDNSTKLATTAYADAIAALMLLLTGGTMTGPLNMNGQPISLISTLNGGPLSGLRNKLINGGFDFAQRSTSSASKGYWTLDRWYNDVVGSTCTFSQQKFTVGQGVVPGEPEFFARCVVAGVSGANNFVYITQSLEDVRTMAGRHCTLTFWARTDAAKPLGIELYQYFGGGGSPSAIVEVINTQVTLSTSWARYDIQINVPSIAGKTLGTDGFDALILGLWMDAGSSNFTVSGGIGRQSGTFEFARASLVEGDATKEFDPYSARGPEQELALCQRYYEKSYNVDVAVGTATSLGAWIHYQTGFTSAVLTGGGSIRYAVTKALQPSITVYSTTSGATGKMRDTVNSADVNLSVLNNGVGGFAMSAATSAASTQINMQAHWSADSEL